MEINLFYSILFYSILFYLMYRRDHGSEMYGIEEDNEDANEFEDFAMMHNNDYGGHHFVKAEKRRTTHNSGVAESHI